MKYLNFRAKNPIEKPSISVISVQKLKYFIDSFLAWKFKYLSRQFF